MTTNHHTRRITLPGGGWIDITTLNPEAARQAETNRQLQEAGIRLTPEQESQLQQAYSNAINHTLDLEQQQIWKQYLSEQTAKLVDPIDDEFPIRRNRADEAQQWEEIKQLLSNAELPLTPDQEAEMQQVHDQMGTELEQEFKAHPIRAFIQLLLPFFLPESIAQQLFGFSPAGSSISAYLTAVNKILTPEQKQIWDRYWVERLNREQSY